LPRIHILVLPIVLSLLQPAFAARITLPTPTGSGSFGSSVTVLPNQNFVVTNLGFDDPVSGVLNVGAVFLFSPAGALMSTPARVYIERDGRAENYRVVKW